MVDNRVSHFNKKIDICVDIVSKILGMPSPSNHHKKYLIYIPNADDHASLGFPEGCKIDTFDVIETLIKVNNPSSDFEEIFLRKRGKTNAYSYT